MPANAIYQIGIRNVDRSAENHSRESGSPQGKGPRWQGFTPIGNPNVPEPSSVLEQGRHSVMGHFGTFSRAMPGVGSPLPSRPHTVLKDHFDPSELSTQKQYDVTIGSAAPKTRDDIRWHNVGAHGAPVCGRAPNDRTVPVLLKRRTEMWRNNMTARNLFKTCQGNRLAALDRAMDPTMISTQRNPTEPGDIIRAQKDLSELRQRFGQTRRAAIAQEASHMKRSSRYGASHHGRVLGRSDMAAVLQVWNQTAVSASPTDVTEWLDKHSGLNPFVDS